jgi:hypothetical protein
MVCYPESRGTITYGLNVPAGAVSNQHRRLVTAALVHRTRGYVFKLGAFIGNTLPFEH